MELAAEKIEQAAAKVDAALAREVEKHERDARRSAKKADAIERFTNTIGALDIWTRIEPRGRRPRFNRGEIAATAIRIADDEGLDALSMRHLASELGAGTMTLYHYVRTKDELMALVMDALMGEVVLPESQALPQGWRDALGHLARRSRDVMFRHPWMFDVAHEAFFGPNGMRHFDETLRAVASIDLPLRDRLRIASVVDEYTFGFCLANWNDMDGVSDELSPSVRDYVTGLLDTGDYPEIERLADELGLDGAWEQMGASRRDPSRFEQGLAIVLDGIEVWIEGRGRR